MGCSPSQATPDPASETIPNGQNMNHPPNSETDSANGNSSRIQSNGNSTNGEVKIRKYSRELGVTVCFGPMKVIQPQMKRLRSNGKAIFPTTLDRSGLKKKTNGAFLIDISQYGVD
ncbi:uncharacterized protein TRIADDRAFT_54829 [Trichoplax adhaerens]|uniref:Uncharacterized protein n=1 Tax=Trichoplax adhaerens TaxID=10228 RepID=B3RT42_TRIAD|nr:predicted protein [Trichoplax adhaerens]EDV26627.1 predicted protein [Trichoplax adhaerens]|eukprot:XP_002110623.1 predicted protein [Trichoplax adhaerens]